MTTHPECLKALSGPEREREICKYFLSNKGVCEYCHKAIEVRMNQAWHSKGEKVWHEVCSFQDQIETLAAELKLLREERTRMRAEVVQECIGEINDLAQRNLCCACGNVDTGRLTESLQDLKAAVHP